jgi:hypothetical protein
MGKRELVIAAAVVLIGLAVYQFTAPPSDPSANGFSVGKIVNEIRREIRGQRANAETTFSATRDLPETVTEMRLVFPIGAITITGEDRDDVKAEMHVRSTGYDAEEAEKLAKASHLVFDEAGALLIVGAKFPVEGRQTPTLHLKVPRRLGVRIDEKGSALEIKNVASLFIGAGRGATTISGIEGVVNVTQRGNELTITDVGSLKLSTVTGTEAVVSNVRGDASFTIQGGELRAQAIGGAIDLESRNAEIEFDKLAETKGPLRIDATLGELVLNGVAADTRIDGRRSEIRIDHAGGAPLAVYNEGDETIEVTVPSRGFTLDAAAVDGQISVDESIESLGLKREPSGDKEHDTERADARQEVRVSGAVRGGGPAITLRATRGDIVLRGR